MNIKEFQSLNEKEQLMLLSQFGRFKIAFELEKYQFTLYQLRDFYVELKRKLRDAYFEKMVTTSFYDLPCGYKLLLQKAEEFEAY